MVLLVICYLWERQEIEQELKCGYIEAHIVKNYFRHPTFWIRLVKINDYLTFKKLKAHVYSDRFVLF